MYRHTNALQSSKVGGWMRHIKETCKQGRGAVHTRSINGSKGHYKKWSLSHGIRDGNPTTINRTRGSLGLRLGAGGLFGARIPQGETLKTMTHDQLEDKVYGHPNITNTYFGQLERHPALAAVVAEGPLKYTVVVAMPKFRSNPNFRDQAAPGSEEAATPVPLVYRRLPQHWKAALVPLQSLLRESLNSTSDIVTLATSSANVQISRRKDGMFEIRKNLFESLSSSPSNLDKASDGQELGISFVDPREAVVVAMARLLKSHASSVADRYNRVTYKRPEAAERLLLKSQKSVQQPLKPVVMPSLSDRKRGALFAISPETPMQSTNVKTSTATKLDTSNGTGACLVSDSQVGIFSLLKSLGEAGSSSSQGNQSTRAPLLLCSCLRVDPNWAGALRCDSGGTTDGNHVPKNSIKRRAGHERSLHLEPEMRAVLVEAASEACTRANAEKEVANHASPSTAVRSATISNNSIESSSTRRTSFVSLTASLPAAAVCQWTYYNADARTPLSRAEAYAGVKTQELPWDRRRVIRQPRWDQRLGRDVNPLTEAVMSDLESRLERSSAGETPAQLKKTHVVLLVRCFTPKMAPADPINDDVHQDVAADAVTSTTTRLGEEPAESQPILSPANKALKTSEWELADMLASLVSDANAGRANLSRKSPETPPTFDSSTNMTFSIGDVLMKSPSLSTILTPLRAVASVRGAVEAAASLVKRDVAEQTEGDVAKAATTRRDRQLRRQQMAEAQTIVTSAQSAHCPLISFMNDSVRNPTTAYLKTKYNLHPVVEDAVGAIRSINTWHRGLVRVATAEARPTNASVEVHGSVAASEYMIATAM